MKISLNWLRDYVDLPADIGIDQIMHDLTMATVEVEGVEDLQAQLQQIVVGRVLSVKHELENSKLACVLCDVAGGRPLQILCGAGNVREGMLVPVALPGASIVPHGKQDSIEIKAQEIAGRQSEAVICAASELALESLFPEQGDEDILDLSAFDGVPGDALAPLIGWDDFIFDVDNKSLTNRPDLWGHYGIAREMAAIYNRQLKPLPGASYGDIPSEALFCESDEPACKRFTASRIRGVQAGVAPFWMRSRLARVDQRPINLYVDLTNYVMFATGQPSHAYDAAHLTLPLSVRRLGDGERVALLDGQEADGDRMTLAVVDVEKAVALAGVMGGAESVIGDDTEEVVLEVASFDAITVRRASARLGLRSEASSRFEKAIDTQRVDMALALFRNLLGELQPGASFTGFHDYHPAPTEHRMIDVSVEFLRERLGKSLPSKDMLATLESLGFEVEKPGGTLHVKVPTWRSTGDVSLPHDLIEEVARIHGYDNFSFVPPQVTLANQKTELALRLERRIKELLALVGGMHEVISYPWAKDRYLEATGFSKDNAPRISGAPAPDQDALRPSLVPNLIEMVARNLRYQAAFEIFESGRVFSAAAASDLSGFRGPSHGNRLAAAFVGSDTLSMFLRAKGLIDAVGRAAYIAAFEYSSTCPASWADESGRVSIEANGEFVGSLGVLTNRAKRIAGIKQAQVVVFELDLDAVKRLPSRDNEYRPLSEYPESAFDLSLVFDNEVKWEEICTVVECCHELIKNVQFVDQYRGKGIEEGKKSITLRIQLWSESRTLQSTEVKDAGNLVVSRLQEKFAAHIRS